MNQFNGIYYDGTSSKQNDVLFGFNLVEKTITFFYKETVQSWFLTDCSIDVSDQEIQIAIDDSDELVVFRDDVDLIRGLLKELQPPTLYSRVLGAKLYVHVLILFGILGFLYLGNQYVVPMVAEKAVGVIPESFDNKIGDTFLDEFYKTNNVDSLKTKKINEFVKKLEFENREELEFYVIESSTINAFCLPNGTIVIYTGILNILENENELIGLLGHEIAHYKKRHSVKAMCKNLASYLFWSLLTNDMASVTGILAENTQTIQQLSFSREYEEEADKEGLRFVLKNKANPEGMVTLFKKLSEESLYDIPEILSTHPNSLERASKIKKGLDGGVEYQTNKVLNRLFLDLKK